MEKGWSQRRSSEGDAADSAQQNCSSGPGNADGAGKQEKLSFLHSGTTIRVMLE